MSGHAGPDHIYAFKSDTTGSVRVSTCGSHFETHINLYHDINEMGTTCDSISNYQGSLSSAVSFCNQYGMRSIQSHHSTGPERCYYNSDTEHPEWWTPSYWATDFDFTAPADKTFWISVTGARRATVTRARRAWFC